MKLSLRNLWVALTCALLYFSAISFRVSALFEEQAGEHDWAIENIGLATNTLFLSNRVITSTESGVLASVDRNLGVLNWRVVLPSNGNDIHKMIIGEKSVVTLARAKQSERLAFVLSSWNLNNGILEWESVLPVDSVVDSTRLPTDLLFDATQKRLQVLAANCVSYVSKQRGSTIGSSFCGSSYGLDSEAKFTFLVSQLTLPLSSVDKKLPDNNSHESRVAVGCTVPKTEPFDTATCQNVGYVIGVNAEQTSFHVKTVMNAPFPVSADSIRSTLAQSGKLTASDVAIGFDRTRREVFILSFVGEGAVVSIPALTHSAATEYRSHLVLTAESDIALVLTSCDTITCALSLPISSHTSILDMETCSSDRESVYNSVIVGSNQQTSLSSVSSSLSCIIGNKNSVVLKQFTVKADGFQVAESKLMHKQQYLLGPSGFHYASVAADASGDGACWGLVVSRTGMTSCFGSTATTNVLSVVWTRDEALANAHSSLQFELSTHTVSNAVEEDSVSFSSTSGHDALIVGVDDSFNIVPGFRTRLALQRVELVETAEALIDYAKAFPSQIVSYVQGLLRIGDNTAEDAPIEGLGQSHAGPAKVTAMVRSTRRRASRLARQAVLLNSRCGLNAIKSARTDALVEHAHALDSHVQRARSRKFGFNKVSLFVSASSNELLLKDQVSRASGSSAVSFADAAVRVVAVDLLTGSPLWTVEPIIDVEDNVQWVHLLSMKDSTESGSPYASLLVLTTSGNLYTWDLDPNTGLEHKCASSATDSCSSTLSQGGTKYFKVMKHSSVIRSVGNVQSIAGFTSHSTASPAVDSHAVGVSADASSLLYHAQYVLIAASSTEDTVQVTLYPKQKSGIGKPSNETHFVHSVDSERGMFQSYQIVSSSCSESSTVKGIFQCVAVAIASLNFGQASEAVLSVTYPSAHDQIDKRFSVLGDDSVLLKYINHHTALIATISPPEARFNPRLCETFVTSSSACEDGGQSSGSSVAGIECRLHVTLVDTVSAKVIYRVHHENSAGPVHATLIENMIAYSFWNAKAKRTELSTIALYDGMVDRYGLTPFASTASANHAAAIQRDNMFSSFTANVPLGTQRTYILPRAVTALHHTTSALGISNKNIILGVAPGQLYSLDMRAVHPRRPLQEPSLPEKEEGLTQYQPFVTLPPIHAISLDHMIGGGVKHISSAPTHLESTTLVLGYGGLDIFFNRVQSSGGFDLLASDFNYSMLVMILSGLGFGAYFLRSMYVRRSLATAWA